MDWYVSKQGTTVGPMSAELLREAIANGQVTRGMHVRDEGTGWIPIESSPFASLLPPVVAAKPAQNNQAAAGCLSAIVLFVIVGWLFTRCGKADDEPSSPQVDAQAAEQAAEKKRLDNKLVSAWTMSQQFVADRLKSPGTADYGSLFKGTLQTYSKQCRELVRDKQYRCAGWVDSQNTFGAVVRTNWDMTLENTSGDTWTLVELHSME